jgi:DNA replication and repair protein RecF
MFVQKLSLVNFKNYSEATVSLHPKLNCFVGDNGTGKTNLLDALYYLCMCKSYFNITDVYSIRHNEPFMILQADIIKEDKKEELYCGLKRNQKKQFRRNKKEYTKLSDHIGSFPVVMVSPIDIQLIQDGSEERRKYINSVIAQYDKIYLINTLQYNRVLSQRNRLLKEMPDGKKSDELLSIYDEQLAGFGNSIYESRVDFIKKFIPVFNRYYHDISGGNESVELIYQSQLNDGDFAAQLKENRYKDFKVQFTTIGIHKDDLILNLDGIPIKRIGSQGQMKTYLVSLKFAQFEFLMKLKNLPPLLLLDDVFDKLDVNRVRHILRLVSQDSFGQIFITHTNLDRMKGILTELNLGHNLFEVQDGNVTLLDDSMDSVHLS